MSGRANSPFARVRAVSRCVWRGPFRAASRGAESPALHQHGTRANAWMERVARPFQGRANINIEHALMLGWSNERVRSEARSVALLARVQERPLEARPADRVRNRRAVGRRRERSIAPCTDDSELCGHAAHARATDVPLDPTRIEPKIVRCRQRRRQKCDPVTRMLSP